MLKEFKSLLQSCIWSMKIVSLAVGKIYVGTTLVLMISLGVFPILTNVAFSQVVQQLTNKELQLAVIFLWLFVLGNLFEKIFDGTDSLISGIMVRRVEKFMTFKFTQKLAELDNYTLESPLYTNVVSKANDGYGWRIQNLNQYFIGFISSSSSIIGNLIAFLVLSPVSALVIFLTLLPKIYVNLKYSKRAYGIWDSDTETRKKYYKISQYLTETENKTELRLTNSVKVLTNLKLDLFTSFFNNQAKLSLKRDTYSIAADILSYLGLAAIITASFIATWNGQMDIAGFTLIFALSAGFAEQLAKLFYDASRIQDNAQYAKALMEFFALKPVILFGNKNLDANNAIQLQIKDLNFTYPNAEHASLTNINLNIEAGQKIAIVGENGAGKTTLIKLITRQYLPTSGQILINNVPIEEYTQDSLYMAIGSLQQDFAKFEFLTVKDAIGIGNPEQMDNLEGIIQAAELSGANKVIDELTLGYNQVLSKDLSNGTDLSGGEWQKVAIARTLYKDSGLILLDEPTSAIDPVAEAEIFKNIYSKIQHKTVIIISHKFSTVKNANRILVMDNGGIVEDGTHDELIKLNGKYANAFNIQASAYASN